MEKQNTIKVFEEKQVRTVWDAELENWFFSIIDVIAALTGTDRPRKYWSDLKTKLLKEGSQLSDKIGQLKLPASDGKSYRTDVADTEELFRLIQSIPSPKAEPFKLWLAEVASASMERTELLHHHPYRPAILQQQHVQSSANSFQVHGIHARLNDQGAYPLPSAVQ